MLTSRTIDAAEAYRAGFVQRIADPGGAVEVALQVAGEIAANDADTVAHLRRQFARDSALDERIAAENAQLRRHARHGFS